MIRRILIFPLKVLRFILLIIGVTIFIGIGILEYFIQNRGSIDPVLYSSDGKVVDINEFKGKAK